MASTVRARNSLTNRIIFAMLAIFWAGIWSLGFYASNELREDMEQLLGEQQYSAASFMAANIDSQLRDRFDVLEQIAARMPPALLGKPAAAQTFLADRFALAEHFNDGVWILGADGTVIAAPPRGGADTLDAAAIDGALREGRAAVSRPVIDPQRGVSAFGMVVPVRDARGHIVGALYGVTDLAKSNFLDMLTEGRYGKSGTYLLVAPQSRLIVAASDRQRVALPVPPPGANAQIDRFIAGYEGSSVLRGGLGEEVLASAKRVPAADWLVVISLPTAEAFAPIRSMQRRMLLATVFLTLLAGGLGWWMLRRQLSPLQATARLLSALPDTVCPATPLPIARQDEIGVLIGAFNRLLASLAQREDALQRNHLYTQTILDSLQQQIAVLDQDGTITTVNAAWRRFALENGALPGQAAERTEVGVNYLEICRSSSGDGQEEARHALEGIRQVIDGALPSFSFEYACHAPQQQHWFVMTATPLPREERGAVITHYDITARKTFEAVLESKTLLQGVIDSTPDWIHVKDREHRFILVNRSFAAALGLTPDDMIGRPDADFVPREICIGDPAQGIRGLHPDDDAVFAGRTIHDPHDKIFIENGATRFFDTFKGPLYDTAQRIYGVLTYRRDITERFVTEQEQRTLENQLRQAQKMELIGHLTGGIAHDFNNILAAMLGYAELLQMEPDMQHSQRLSGYLAEILQGGIRAKELVAQLLTFSQKKEPATQTINAGPIVKEVVKLLRATMPTSITINTRIAKNLPGVLIGPVQLHQIVMNLSVNARDAMDGKGTIEIRVKSAAREASRICASCHRPFSGDYLMISVRDTGTGIAAEIMTKIFDPFFTTKGVGRGSGLGLSVLHGIVHSANGHIDVHTAPGEGTEFRIYLPARASAPGRLVAETRPDNATPRLRGHVMVVDDEASIVGFMTAQLENLGCKATGLGSATEALRIFRDNPYDVDMIITDQTMPDMTGAKLAAAMLACRPDIPVILITGYSNAIDADAARQIGIRRIIAKPVPARVLANLVAEMLGDRLAPGA